MRRRQQQKRWKRCLVRFDWLRKDTSVDVYGCWLFVLLRAFLEGTKTLLLVASWNRDILKNIYAEFCHWTSELIFPGLLNFGDLLQLNMIGHLVSWVVLGRVEDSSIPEPILLTIFAGEREDSITRWRNRFWLVQSLDRPFASFLQGRDSPIVKHYPQIKNPCFVTCVNSALCSKS
jgi:hypothetical protein